jgi:hypothetical protein
MSRIANHYVSKRVSFLFVAEVLILMASVYLAAQLQVRNDSESLAGH